MPVIQSPSSPSTRLFPRVARWLEFKQHWADDWNPNNYWVPERARIEVAPGHGSLSASHWLGNVKPEGGAAKQLFQPQDVSEWYCRAMLCRVGGQPVAVWTGYIPDSTIVVDSPTVGRTQGIEAFGLTWLLDRQPLTTSWAIHNGQLIEVDDLLFFNRRNPGRGLSLAGNRSKNKDSTLGCYVFQGGSDGGRVWSSLDIAEYLVKTHAYATPNGVQFKFGGMTAALAAMKNEWQQQGTAWQMLCKLIDRRHGLIFFPKMTTSNNGASAVTLWITSEVETSITYGGQTLPANPTQVSFTLPTTGVDQHLPLDITCRFTDVGRYDELVIRGNLVVMMFTLSNLDGTLDKGWTTALQLEAESAGNATDETVADEFRKQWKYHDVYTKFVVPPAWNGNVRDGTGTGNALPVTPKPLDDGTFDAMLQGEFLRAFKTFNRELTIEKGKRYDVIPVENTNDPEAEPEFRPLFAALLDDFDGANHVATNKWIRVDQLGSGQSGLHNLSVSTLDKDLGVRITCHPAHYLAGDDWDPANVTNVHPEINWRSLIVTACMTTDVRPAIRIQLSNPSENNRQKVIDVPADFWFAVKRTVTDVSSAGDLVRIENGNCEIRNEIDKLQAHAAYAELWYGTQRQAVVIPIQMLGVWVELGTYLTGISNAWMWLPVGTTVSSVEWDFPGGVTRITTGHGDDDQTIEPVEFVGKMTKGGRRGRR